MSRTAARPRPAAVHRRRRLTWLLALVAVAAGAYALKPSVESTVRDITLPLRHEDIIRQQARDKHLPPELIAAVIYAESKFTDQTSHAGARGLMQVTPETARGIAERTGGVNFRESDLATPQVNISYGSWYLRNLLDRYGGNEVLALAAYNAGQGNVDRWIAEARAKGESLTIDAIPFGETRAYVDKVLRAERDYRDNYGPELGIG